MATLALQYRDELDPILVDELDQLIGSMEAALVNRLTGKNVSLLLGLQFREQLDPIVADELDQLVAAIQTQFGRRVWVKTTLTGTIEIPVNATSASTTLSVQVDPNNTIVTWLGLSTNTGFAADEYSPKDYEARLALSTDGRTLTATKSDSDATWFSIVGWGVQEFYPGLIKSVQRGTLTFSALDVTKTATIQPVDTARSRVDLLGYSTPYSDFGIGANAESSYLHHVRIALTNSTTVTATVYSAGGEDTVGYQVVEYF